MSLFSNLWAFGGYVWPFLLVLGIVVFFHELGHFMVGRWCGVKADVFSLGFGPEIYGRVDRHGTRWRLALIPLGGYVKFHGDANAASAGADLSSLSEEEMRISFPTQPVWKRALIVAAGPFANFILAAVIFTGGLFRGAWRRHASRRGPAAGRGGGSRRVQARRHHSFHQWQAHRQLGRDAAHRPGLRRHSAGFRG